MWFLVHCMHMSILLNAMIVSLLSAPEADPRSQEHFSGPMWPLCNLLLFLKSCSFKNQWASGTNYRKSISCPFSRFRVFPFCHTTFAMDWHHGPLAITHSHCPNSFCIHIRVDVTAWRFWWMILTVPHLNPFTDPVVKLTLYFLIK